MPRIGLALAANVSHVVGFALDRYLLTPAGADDDEPSTPQVRVAARTLGDWRIEVALQQRRPDAAHS